jgi:hypothetical protein
MIAFKARPHIPGKSESRCFTRLGGVALVDVKVAFGAWAAAAISGGEGPQWDK